MFLAVRISSYECVCASSDPNASFVLSKLPACIPSSNVLIVFKPSLIARNQYERIPGWSNQSKWNTKRCKRVN